MVQPSRQGWERMEQEQAQAAFMLKCEMLQIPRVISLLLITVPLQRMTENPWVSVVHDGTGNISIDNRAAGSIVTHGDGSLGISAVMNNAAGSINIANHAGLTTHGKDAHGIHVYSANTDATKTDAVTVNSHGAITTSDGRGIFVRAENGDVNIFASNNITTGQATSTIHNHGIDAAVLGSGTTTVNYDQGTIKVVGATASNGNSVGIAAWDSGTGTQTSNTVINLGSSAIIDAASGVGGLQIRSSGNGEVNIAAGAEVHGGESYGVQFFSTVGTGSNAKFMLNNAGTIDSMNDRAIAVAAADAGSKINLNNHGSVTGYLDLSGVAGDVILTNGAAGTIDLRHYADTNKDGVRDTKGVAISNFGTGNSKFINDGYATARRDYRTKHN